MKIRQFVRNHLKLKNLLSNLELLGKAIRNKSVLADYEYSPDEYYSCVHVHFGHIPAPLIWKSVAHRLNYVQNTESHWECVSGVKWDEYDVDDDIDWELAQDAEDENFGAIVS